MISCPARAGYNVHAMRTARHALLAAFLLFFALPLRAAEKPDPRTVAQVDGITDRVVDRLWGAVDGYWHQGDYRRIVALARICVEADPGFNEAWSVGAWLLWSLGDTPAADAFLREGVRRNPNVWDLHYELGWHLFNTKRYAEALPSLQSATRFTDAPAQPWKILAHCYEKLGRLDESAAAWRTVVARFPRDPAAPNNLQRVEQARAARDAKP